MNNLTAATYARVSTVKQGEGISLSEQEERMKGYAAQNNITVAYSFKETFSGMEEERPEYAKIRQVLNVFVLHTILIVQYLHR